MFFAMVYPVRNNGHLAPCRFVALFLTGYTKDMTQTVLGIDEAGRGAVLGPLVVAGVLFADTPQLRELLYAQRVRDSKLLTRPQRERLARVVRSHKQGYRTRAIAPARIDRTSLNELEIEASAQIINVLTPHTALLDVPASGSGVERYRDAVRARCKHFAHIKGENKMDATNVMVAAASILAKERREQEVRKLHKRYGDFGSGYPSDPKTRTWLKDWRRTHNTWPDIVRLKWKTIKNF